MRNADSDKLIWSMMYASLVAFCAHPGNVKLINLNDERLDYFAEIADNAFRRYIKRFS